MNSARRKADTTSATPRVRKEQLFRGARIIYSAASLASRTSDTCMTTRSRHLIVLLLSFIPLTTGYSQQTFDISTFPTAGGPETVISGMLGSFGGNVSGGAFTQITAIGQTFTAPAPAVRLDRFGFWLAGGDNCAAGPDSFCDMTSLQ